MSVFKILVPKFIPGGKSKHYRAHRPYLLWQYRIWHLSIGFDYEELWIGVRWHKEPTQALGYESYIDVHFCPFPGLVINVSWLIKDPQARLTKDPQSL